MKTLIRRPRGRLVAFALPGLVLLVLAHALASAAQTPPDSAQQVVDKAIAFHGGDLYRASKSSLTITSRSGSFRIVSRVDGDRFDHTVFSERGGGTRKVRSTNDAVEVWEDGRRGELEAGREQRLRDFVSARIYFPFLPYRLNDPGVRKQDLGEETWEGRKLRKIKVSFDAGSSTDAQDEYLYWFDPESGRLEQFAYSFVAGEGGLRFRKGFNYRRVGGILFFDSENYGLDGQGRKVEQITPAFVAENMELISTVALSEIEVEPLP